MSRAGGYPKVVAQFAWTSAVCADYGFGFEAWWGCDPVLLENVRFLAGYRRAELIDLQIAGLVRDRVGEGVAIWALERMLDPPGAVASAVVRCALGGSVPAVGCGHSCFGGGVVNVRTVAVSAGASVFYDGEVAVVVEFDGRNVALRLAGGGYRSVGLAEFAACSRSVDQAGGAPGLVLAGLSGQEREQVVARSRHVREVLTGYAAGYEGGAEQAEPRAQYAPGTRQTARYRAKAAYAQLKTAILAGRVLRSCSTAMIEQEVWAILIAYQALVRALVAAADAGRIDPDRLSFTIALETARDQIVLAAGLWPDPAQPSAITRTLLANPHPARRRQRLRARTVKTISKYWSNHGKQPAKTQSYDLDITIGIFEHPLPAHPRP